MPYIDSNIKIMLQEQNPDSSLICPFIFDFQN